MDYALRIIMLDHLENQSFRRQRRSKGMSREKRQIESVSVIKYENQLFGNYPNQLNKNNGSYFKH